MACEKYEEKLWARHDGKLTKEAQEDLEEHLKSCTACQKTADLIEHVEQGFNTIKTVPIPESFHKDLMQRIKVTPQVQSPKKIRLSRGLEWGMGVAAAIGIMAIGFNGFNGPQTMAPENTPMVASRVAPKQEESVAGTSDNIKGFESEEPVSAASIEEPETQSMPQEAVDKKTNKNTEVQSQAMHSPEKKPIEKAYSKAQQQTAQEDVLPSKTQAAGPEDIDKHSKAESMQPKALEDTHEENALIRKENNLNTEYEPTADCTAQNETYNVAPNIKGDLVKGSLENVDEVEWFEAFEEYANKEHIQYKYEENEKGKLLIIEDLKDRSAFEAFLKQQDVKLELQEEATRNLSLQLVPKK